MSEMTTTKPNDRAPLGDVFRDTVSVEVEGSNLWDEVYKQLVRTRVGSLLVVDWLEVAPDCPVATPLPCKMWDVPAFESARVPSRCVVIRSHDLSEIEKVRHGGRVVNKRKLADKLDAIRDVEFLRDAAAMNADGEGAEA